MPTIATTRPMMTRLALSPCRKRAATSALGVAMTVFIPVARSSRRTDRVSSRRPLRRRVPPAARRCRRRDRAVSKASPGRRCHAALRARGQTEAGAVFQYEVPAHSCSHLHDLLLLRGDEMIHFADVFVGDFLHAFVGAAVLIFSDF